MKEWVNRTMEAIRGNPANLKPEEFIKVCDLIYFDGPILSHFKRSGKDYIFYWVDYDSKHHRFMIVNISNDALMKYLKCEISTRDLFKSCPNEPVYFVDIGHTLIYENAKSVKLSDVPDYYYPE